MCAATLREALCDSIKTGALGTANDCGIASVAASGFCKTHTRTIKGVASLLFLLHLYIPFSRPPKTLLRISKAAPARYIVMDEERKISDINPNTNPKVELAQYFDTTETPIHSFEKFQDAENILRRLMHQKTNMLSG